MFVVLLNKKMDIVGFVGFVALPNIFYIANFKITRIEAPKIGLEMHFILICIIATIRLFFEMILRSESRF